jgi:hypothetical protein
MTKRGPLLCVVVAAALPLVPFLRGSIQRAASTEASSGCKPEEGLGVGGREEGCERALPGLHTYHACFFFLHLGVLRGTPFCPSSSMRGEVSRGDCSPEWCNMRGIRRCSR